MANKNKGGKMTEETIVRENLMTVEGYTGYCPNITARDFKGGCNNPRTKWDGEQFVCPECRWRSEFPQDFIDRYKLKWKL